MFPAHEDFIADCNRPRKRAVTSVEPGQGVQEREVVKAAAIAERRSEHPLTRAVLAKAAQIAISAVEPDRFGTKRPEVQILSPRLHKPL